MDRSSSWGPRVWGNRLCKVMGGEMERIWGGMRRLWELGGGPVILRLSKGTHSPGRGYWGPQLSRHRMEGLGLPLGGLARSPRDGVGGADLCGAWEVPGPAGMRGAGGPAEGEGRPPALLSGPAPPAASEQTFLSLQVEAGAAGGGGCTAKQAACARSAVPGSSTRRPADPQARGPGPAAAPAPASAPCAPGVWRGAVGAGGAKLRAGHGLGLRCAGPRRQRAGGRAGQPGPCLVPPRPEPRCCRGTAGPGRPRWQLPGPRQRERGGRLRALRPVSGAGAVGGRAGARSGVP